MRLPPKVRQNEFFVPYGCDLNSFDRDDEINYVVIMPDDWDNFAPWQISMRSDLKQAGNAEEAVEILLTRFQRRLDADFAVFNVFDTVTGWIIGAATHSGLGLDFEGSFDAMKRLVPEHRAIRMFTSSRCPFGKVFNPEHGFSTPREYECSELFNDFLRKLNSRHQLCVALGEYRLDGNFLFGPRRFISFLTLNRRQKQFHKDLYKELKASVLYLRAEIPDVLDRISRKIGLKGVPNYVPNLEEGTVKVEADGRILDISQRAEEILITHFEWTVECGKLPAALQAAIIRIVEEKGCLRRVYPNLYGSEIITLYGHIVLDLKVAVRFGSRTVIDIHLSESRSRPSQSLPYELSLEGLGEEESKILLDMLMGKRVEDTASERQRALETVRKQRSIIRKKLKLRGVSEVGFVMNSRLDPEDVRIIRALIRKESESGHR